MIDERLVIRVQAPVWASGVQLYMYGEDSRGLVTGLQLTATDPRTAPAQPSAVMSEQYAQELMDTLYAAGFRPTMAKDTAGITDAVKKHLEDMRTIAFDRLKINKQG